ncbi:MAG: HD domain-containing phosphohydrolase [Sulfurimonas sp.]
MKLDSFVVIIKVGTLLSDNMYNKLLKQDQLYISVKNHGVKDLQCSHILQYVQENISSNKKILNLLYVIHKKNYPHLLQEHYSQETTQCLNHMIETIIYIIEEKKDFIKDTISYFSDSYELETHLLHVALYAVNLGYLLHFNKEELLQIGLVGLLYDLGVNTVDEDILQKDSKLETKELNIISKHPEKSVQIAHQNHINNPYIIDAIMHHHERYDGSGYPDNLLENEISKFASIIGICDVFNALTNNRPYRTKYTYFEALKFMIKDGSMTNKFNPKYLQTFLKSLI